MRFTDLFSLAPASSGADKAEIAPSQAVQPIVTYKPQPFYNRQGSSQACCSPNSSAASGPQSPSLLGSTISALVVSQCPPSGKYFLKVECACDVQTPIITLEGNCQLHAGKLERRKTECLDRATVSGEAVRARAWDPVSRPWGAEPLWRKARRVFQQDMVFYFTIAGGWEIPGGPGSCVLSLVWSPGWGQRLITHKRHSLRKAILSNWIRQRGSRQSIPKSRMLFVFPSLPTGCVLMKRSFMAVGTSASEPASGSPFFFSHRAVLLKDLLLKTNSRCSSDIINNLAWGGLIPFRPFQDTLSWNGLIPFLCWKYKYSRKLRDPYQSSIFYMYLFKMM